MEPVEKLVMYCSSIAYHHRHHIHNSISTTIMSGLGFRSSHQQQEEEEEEEGRGAHLLLTIGCMLLRLLETLHHPCHQRGIVSGVHLSR